MAARTMVMTMATLAAVSARPAIRTPAGTGAARRRLRIPDSRCAVTESARLLPFAADARYPRLFRSPCAGAAAVLLVLGSATALLAYRPAAGDAGGLFFLGLGARAPAGLPPPGPGPRRGLAGTSPR